MITDYKLLEVPNNRELQKEVKRFISKGWEPFGSPVYCGFTTRKPTERVYAQAIVKRRPESEELAELRMKLAEVNLTTTAGLVGTVSEREALEDIARLFRRQKG